MQLNISMNSNGPNEYSMPQYIYIYIYMYRCNLLDNEYSAQADLCCQMKPTEFIDYFFIHI